MKKFEHILTSLLQALLAACTFVIAALVITLVVLRYAFNSSITGANEIITVLFVYTTALGAAIAVGQREHIAISFAVEQLPPRGRKLADAAGLLLIATLNGIMFAYSIRWIQITGGYLMPSTGLARAVAQLSIPLGCGVAIVYCLLKLVLALRGIDELDPRWKRED